MGWLNPPRSCNASPALNIPRSILKSIDAIQLQLTLAKKAARQNFDLHTAILGLFRQSKKIAGGAESIKAVLALAADIEAFRGKGSQMAARKFSDGLRLLPGFVMARLPQSESTSDLVSNETKDSSSAKDALDCLERLAAHSFARTLAAPTRSEHAGLLKTAAWEVLGEISEIHRRPEYLAQALKVAAENRASSSERMAAIDFLVSYWAGDEPDEATLNLLWTLVQNPPDRSFLVTALQAQIEFGIGDEFDAMCAVDDWEDANEGH